MTITALMSWFDDPPAAIERAIRSAAEIVDHLVAVDGAYASFPGGEASSPEEQREVIQRVAADCGLDLLLYEPATVWGGGEPAKRDFMFRLADTLGADWYTVLDTDFVFEYPYKTGAAAVHADLKMAEKHGFEVCRGQLVDYLANDETGKRSKTLAELPIFWRAKGLPPLRIGPTHYHTWREGYETHLWGCARTPQLPHFDMTDTIRVQHEWWHRVESRQAAKWGYYVLREAHQLEVNEFQLKSTPEEATVTSPDQIAEVI